MGIASPAGKTIRYYVNCAVSFGIIILFRLLPPFGTLTGTGMQVTGIFIGIIYALSTVDVVWPALLGLVLLGCTELYTMTGAFAAAFGNETWLFILFILGFVSVVTNSGVSSIIANWMVSRKFSRGRPWVISWLLLTSAYVVSALVSATPGVVIPWAMLYTMCESYGYKKHDKYPTLMVIGITLASLMGNAIFPFEALAMMAQSSFTSHTGETIDFGRFTILSGALTYGVVLTYLFVCRFIFRPDVSLIRRNDWIYEGNTRLSRHQKYVLALLAVLLFLLFVPDALPDTVPGVGLVDRIGRPGVCALLLCAAGLLPPEKGKTRLDLARTMKDGIPWPTMLLLAFALVMTSAITNEATGIQPFLESVFAPVFGNTPSPVIFIFAVCAVQLVLTNVFANMVIALLLVPLVCVYAPMAGVSTAMMVVCICVLTNVSIVLPSASPFAALLHGNSEWVTSGEIYKYGSVAVVFVSVTSTVICATLGELLF